MPKLKQVLCSIAFLLFVFCSESIYAQNKHQITGRVLDGAGETIIGASVTETGTTNGTVTDVDGSFSLSVSPNSSITISLIGYISQTIAVKGEKNFNIVLQEDTKLLDEVVVVGYGTQKKKDLTSSIATIDSKALANQAVANPVAAMQGRMTGVQVTNSGEPGSSPSIKIRGTGSVYSTKPLYVIDGMILDNMDHLSPSDIENISVLKDASASAIYGIRAAGGVVLVTTKKGSKDGKLNVSFNSYIGIKKASHIQKMVNTPEYITLHNEKINMMNQYGLSNSTVGLIDPSKHTAYTKWFDEVLNSTYTNNQDISISGGTERATYNVGLNHLKDDGLIKNDNYERIGLRASYDYKISKYVDAGINIITTSSKANPANGLVLNYAYQAIPFLTPRDENGEFSDPSNINGFKVDSSNNPSATLFYNHRWRNSFNSSTNGYINIKFLENFAFRSTVGVNKNFGTSVTYNPRYAIGESTQKNAMNTLNKNNNNSTNISFDNILNYENSFAKLHNVKAMVGYTYLQYKYDYVNTSAKDLVDIPKVDQSFLYIGVGKGSKYGAEISDGGDKVVQLGFVSRLSYDYAHKYLLNATMRIDQSSKFPENNRTGYFPSVGLGWVVSEEPFMKEISSIDFLKIRAGWGLLGNDNIPNSIYKPITSGGTPIIWGPNQNAGEGDVAPSETVDRSFNPDLKWEIVDERNIGFDMSLLNQRLDLTFDYYYKLTKDAVFPVTALGSSGMNSSGTWGNYANILNKGVELSLNWKDKIGDLGYNIGINGSYNKNEVTKISLAAAKYIMAGDNDNNITPLTRTQVGRPVGEFYGYNVIGVFQDQNQIDNTPHQLNTIPGHLIFEDVNKDGKIDEGDRTAIGNPNPPFTYGISLGLEYKGFDFNLFCQGVSGNKIINENRMLMSLTGNYDKDFYENRWTGPGSSNSYPSALIMAGSNKRIMSSFYVEDGSYFRIKNIQLGYTFPESVTQKLKVQKVRWYLNAENPFTFFKYNGFSPEVSSSNPLLTGVNRGVYPLASVYTLGLNLTF